MIQKFFTLIFTILHFTILKKLCEDNERSSTIFFTLTIISICDFFLIQFYKIILKLNACLFIRFFCLTKFPLWNIFLFHSRHNYQRSIEIFRPIFRFSTDCVVLSTRLSQFSRRLQQARILRTYSNPDYVRFAFLTCLVSFSLLQQL